MLKAVFYTLGYTKEAGFEYKTGVIMAHLAISFQCHFGKTNRNTKQKRTNSPKVTLIN